MSSALCLAKRLEAGAPEGAEVETLDLRPDDGGGGLHAPRAGGGLLRASDAREVDAGVGGEKGTTLTAKTPFSRPCARFAHSQPTVQGQVGSQATGMYRARI